MNLVTNIPEYFVSQFNKVFRDIIKSNFDYVRIRGEISEIKTATKGQLYLTLKDDKSILSGVIWETKKRYLQFNPDIGMEVIVTGKITTWSKFKTTYQIDIDKVELAGEGALLKLIEDRKTRLKAKGIFDLMHKKFLPYIPKKIGVITSPTGSVIHDIINRIQDRFPVNIDIWPVAVQGADAAETIISAIRGFNNNDFKDKPDVIIIARGGGSIEDLMAFNDENLAIAVFNSNIPIISAIGHETDTTIIDHVSDFRASTPTAAAEKVVPIRVELEHSVDNLFQRLDNVVQKNIKIYNDKLLNLSKFLKAPIIIINSFKEKFYFLIENLKREINIIFEKNLSKIKNYTQLLRSPDTILYTKKNELMILSKNMDRIIDDRTKNKMNEFNKLIRLLSSNSINTNLKKGYAIVSKSKKIIKISTQIKNEDQIGIKFYDKSVKLKINKFN